MGKALIIQGVDFSSKNLGQVTPEEVIPLISIQIVGPNSVYNAGNTANYSIIYTPAGTSEIGVSWIIRSGSGYASINRTTGALSVLPSAVGGQEIIIRAQSSVNPSVFAEITVNVSYYDVSVSGISIIGPSSIDNLSNSERYEVEYTPEETSQTGVIWQSSDTAVATVDSGGVVTVLSTGNVVITATSVHNAQVVGTKQIACTYNTVTTGGYINFSGAQTSAINLVKPSDSIGNTVIEVKALCRSNGSFYFGCRNSARTVKALLYLKPSQNLQAQYGDIDVNEAHSLSDGTMHVYSFGQTFTIDGVQHGGTNASANAFPEVLSIPYNTGGTPYSPFPSNFGVEYIKIIESGVETHRLVAALVGSDSGFLDQITGEFISTSASNGIYTSAS